MVAVSTACLDNGLKVLSVEQPHLHSACVSFFVHCGSRHEQLAQWGLSHLVEHMLFRGSHRFPDGKRLAQAFERHGGTLAAATWRDHTSLSTPIHPSRLEHALEAMADMVAAPQFSGLDLERSIVEEELQEDLDEDGHDTDINNVSRAAIWHGHPMGRRIAGSFESLRSFGVEDVRRHHERHYVAKNAVLCVAGRVSAREVEDLAARAFAGMPSGRAITDGTAALFAPGDPLVVRRHGGTQLSIQLTFEALPDQHQDFTALTLLTRVLDDGGASRLQHAICERRGLVYELSTGLDCYADCGLYDIEMKVAPRRAATAIATTLEALTTLCSEGIRDDEFELVRERAMHDLEFSVDSTEDLAARYGSASLFGQAEPMDAERRELAAITPADLVRVARRMFLTSRIHATILGPVERANMKRIEKLISDFPPKGDSGI